MSRISLDGFYKRTAKFGATGFILLILLAGSLVADIGC